MADSDYICVKSTPSLLGVPTEIRQIIYDYVFRGENVIHEVHGRDICRISIASYQYGLSSTCKQLREEAHARFVETPTVLVIEGECGHSKTHFFCKLFIPQRILKKLAIVHIRDCGAMRKAALGGSTIGMIQSVEFWRHKLPIRHIYYTIASYNGSGTHWKQNMQSSDDIFRLEHAYPNVWHRIAGGIGPMPEPLALPSLARNLYHRPDGIDLIIWDETDDGQFDLTQAPSRLRLIILMLYRTNSMAPFDLKMKPANIKIWTNKIWSHGGRSMQDGFTLILGRFRKPKSLPDV